MWFATGVVVTLVMTLVVTQAWRVDASGADDGSSFTPIVPCRLSDTRPQSEPAGGKKTPVGPGEANRFRQPITGEVGDCMIPSGVEAVALNVTIVNPTASSFLRLYPTGEDVIPTVSNLNWVAGQPATPNKVDVKVGDDGGIWVANAFGSVDVIIDAVGYYGSAGLLTDFEVVTAEIVVELSSPTDTTGGSVFCPAGKLAVGGNAVVKEQPTLLDWTRNGPSLDLGGWSYGVTGSTTKYTILVRVICASGVILATS